MFSFLCLLLAPAASSLRHKPYYGARKTRIPKALRTDVPIYQQDYASGAPYDAAPVDALVGGVPVIQQTDAAAASVVESCVMIGVLTFMASPSREAPEAVLDAAADRS